MLETFWNNRFIYSYFKHHDGVYLQVLTASRDVFVFV